MKRILGFCVLLWWSLSSMALGGIYVLYVQGDGKTSEMACEGAYSRYGTGDFYTIMDANKGLIYYVRPKEKKYSVVSVEEVRRQMEAALSQMEAMKKQFKALGEKFRGFGKMMGQEEPEKKAPKISYKVTRETAKIAGYKVFKVLELHDGQPYAEFWVSDKLAQDLQKECDWKKLTKMAEDLTPKNLPQVSSSEDKTPLFKGDKGLPGMPLKEVSFKEGLVMEVKKVEKKRLSPAYFSIPKGYKKEEFPSYGHQPRAPFEGGKPW